VTIDSLVSVVTLRYPSAAGSLIALMSADIARATPPQIYRGWVALIRRIIPTQRPGSRTTRV